MNKFERVLSDEEVHNLFALNNDVFCADSEGDFYTREGINLVDTVYLFEIGRNIEQAVLAKLAEQEPVAWTSSKIFGHYVTHDTKATAAEWFKESLDVPLYAHPMPCVSENGESNTQLARHQPCGCIVCYCENQVQCLGCGAEHCGTHDLGEIPNPVYVDHIPSASKMGFDPDEALTLAERTLSIEITELIADEILQFTRKLHEKYTQADHIPDASKMVKSLRGEFAMAALTGLLSNSGGPIQISSQGGWSLVNCTLDDVSSFAYEMADAMLAAAPKYTGEK